MKKVKFAICVIAEVFMIMNGHTNILIKNILNDVPTKGKGEGDINMA